MAAFREVVMAQEREYFDRIAKAEKVITDAGYTRDQTRHIWVLDHKTAKVVREEPGKFYIEWST